MTPASYLIFSSLHFTVRYNACGELACSAFNASPKSHAIIGDVAETASYKGASMLVTLILQLEERFSREDSSVNNCHHVTYAPRLSGGSAQTW